MHDLAEHTAVGIALAAFSLVIMPALSWAQRRAARAACSVQRDKAIPSTISSSRLINAISDGALHDPVSCLH
ncbi:MAG: hypothetical protein EOO77_27285 [Oxalobacteraceae bacterium]|nr:MAG: hypothetical protein EOO77_27285 [Oxalobacteraceae bacterium]